MTKYLYSRLAVNGIKKNKRLYLPYILTSAAMVMMFYIISFLAKGSSLDSVIGGDIMKQTLTFGYIVIAVFSFIFLFYTNSFLIRRRKKEFGLYNILGMGKWNLGRVLVWESLIVAVISILSGLFCGILFSKLAELLMIKVLHTEADFNLSIEWTSVKYTVIVFAAIFVLLLLNTLRQIKISEPIELLHSESAGEKAPKANWLFAFAGFAILIMAYVIAVVIASPIEALLMFFVAVIMVIVATYLLFISGSVVFCKILQKNKKYYYKTNHFVSVSSMVFRMKRNGAGLASICILCTMVLVMVSSTVCLYFGSEESLAQRYPRNVGIETRVNEIAEFDSEMVKEAEDIALKSALSGNIAPQDIMSYRYASFLAQLEENKVKTNDTANYDELNATAFFVVPLEDYNRVMNENETLADNEVLVYVTQNKRYKNDNIVIENGAEYKVKKQVSAFISNGDDVDVMNALPSIFIIVPDFNKAVEPLMKLANFNGDRLVNLKQYYGYNLDCTDEQQIDVYSSMKEQLKQYSEENDIKISTGSAALEKESFYGLYGGLFFLGILLGIVFVFAAVLIIYYKQISEGYEDQSRFEIMQKVGMTKAEIRKSINSQVLTVFFIPLLMSAVHLGFAFPMIYKMLILFGITNLPFLLLVNFASFAVFALFYIIVYKFTSKAYYSIVSE